MRRVLLIVLSLIPVLALGQPVYDCHRAEGKIKIDGKLKEKAWEAASSETSAAKVTLHPST